MKKILTIVPMLLVPFSFALYATEVEGSVYTNGKIYTVNETHTWAEAVAIKEN